MLDRYYHPDAQKLGKKLLAAETKRNQEARVKQASSNQALVAPMVEGST